uniref:ABC transporter permease n=1 Tax=Roseihalotalea indica TaxID=2867963 RepID=A0AA49JB12_9BACT|nr:ABC transporter permease [Tunicatimonas sp. TK19036]
MLTSFLRTAFRSFYRDKSFSLINLLGLSLGIVAFVFIIQYASFEMSYDGFHEHKDNIYRVSRHEYGEHPEASANAFYAIGPEAYNSFPEVVNYTRMHPADGMISYQPESGEPVSFFEDQAYYADTSFFHIFSYPLVQGDLSTLLHNPNSVVISESAARKYFGDTDPMGKVLTLSTAEWEDGDYTVEGVFSDVPANSHLAFDFIFPIENLLHNFQFEGQGWTWINFQNYLLVKPETDVALLQEKLSAFPERYLKPLLSRQNIRMEFHLQAVADINLYAELSGEVKETGKWKKLRVLITAAFFIIGLAWLNYINLTTARAIRRSKEVGLRKVLGSNQWMLVKQFLLESLLINLIAIILAGLMLLLLLPLLRQWVTTPFAFNWDEQYSYWLLFMGIFAAGTLLSGFYPALYLASLKPIQALKGKLSNQGKNYVREALVVIQFTVSLALMVGTVIIYRQIALMQQQDLGMDISQKLIVKAPGTVQQGFWRELDAFKNEVTNQANVKNAAVSFEVPGHNLRWGQEVDVSGGKQDVTLQWTSFDHDFVPAYDIDIIAGRNFSGKFEGPVILINEAAAEALGFDSPEDAIDREVIAAFPRRIIGVISDYHQRSAKFDVEPLGISPFSKERGYITLTIQDHEVAETLAYVEEVYQTLFPGNAFEYFFLDEYFGRQYESDRQFSRIVTLFSGLALFIASLGLLGFTAYLSQSRAKEVGVRKILGAENLNIFMLFNQNVARLVLIASIIALPTVYLLAQQWLTGYATRIELSFMHLALPGIVLLVITLAITSLQLARVIRTNAVDLLQNE